MLVYNIPEIILAQLLRCLMSGADLDAIGIFVIAVTTRQSQKT
jgi:hypothetical protein